MSTTKPAASSTAPLSRETLLSLPPAGLLRRLLVILYDALLLVAILALAILIWLAAFGPVIENPSHVGPFRLYVLSVAFLYFGWFWTHSGQTLPMKTWRVQVINDDGGPIVWPQALMRFCMAVISWLPLGLGYWWALLESDRRCWHDRASRSRLVLLPKK